MTTLKSWINVATRRFSQLSVRCNSTSTTPTTTISNNIAVRLFESSLSHGPVMTNQKSHHSFLHSKNVLCKASHDSSKSILRPFSSWNKEPSNTSNTNTVSTSSASDQEWNAWQRSLLSNVTENEVSFANTSSITKRGGKTLRKRKEALKSVSLSSQERLIEAGPGQFPPMRYSDEETERLLKEAYENIPERTGKRGTRSFKRQKVRFWGIRKARRIKKMEKVRHHFAQMEKRSARVKAIQRMKEIAVETRQEDKLYQQSVLRKWASIQGVALKSVSVGDDDGGGAK